MLNNIKTCVYKTLNTKKTIYRALVLNTIIVLFVCLFFELTTKSDDYDQCLILYGAYSGEYSKYTLYTNYVFSFIIYCLLNCFPAISWYYIFQIVLVLCANVCITYVILKTIEVKNIEMFCVPVLIFCTYEFLIRITFTKTAGYLIVAGFYVFLYVITEQIKSQIEQLVLILVALGLIFSGLIIRGSILLPVLVVFFAAFLIYIYQSYSYLDIKKIMSFVVITICVLLCYKCLSYLNTQQVNRDERLYEYYYNNNNRASIQDYAIADFEKYSDKYNEIGINQLEYDLWHKYAVYLDTDYWTEARISEVRKIASIHDSDSTVVVLNKSLKKILKYYLSDTGIWIIILVGFYVFMSGGRLGYIFVIGGFTLFDYLYMYAMGRQQHHVEVVIDLCFALLVLYCARYEINSKRANSYVVVIICVVLFVNANYSSISSASYYPEYIESGMSQKEKYDYNLEKWNLISGDCAHLYIVDAADTNVYFDAVYTPLQMIPKGKYQNAIKANSYFNTFLDSMLSQYSVDNIYEDITDSTTIYSTYTKKNDISELIEEYIRKRYDRNAKAVIVKEIGDQIVYRFISDEDAFVRKIVSNAKDCKEFTCDVKVSKQHDNLYQFLGYAYIDGFDSYADNIYLQIVNNTTGESQYKIVRNMMCDKLMNGDKTNGKYSGFCESIELENDLEQYDIVLYIEDKGVCYSKNIYL